VIVSQVFIVYEQFRIIWVVSFFWSSPLELSIQPKRKRRKQNKLKTSLFVQDDQRQKGEKRKKESPLRGGKKTD